jgi:HD-GYP domain-containing protein (c-di-GMP phosphodiesterase class II)
MKQSQQQQKSLARTQLLMAVVSLMPLIVLLYIAQTFVFEPLRATGQNATIWSVTATLVFTAMAVILGYIVVRRDTMRTLTAIEEGEARLDRLHSATTEIAALENSNEVHTALLQQAADLINADRAGLWLRDRDELTIARALGMSEERAVAHPLPVGQGLAGRCAELGKSLLNEPITDTDRSWDDRIVTKTNNSLLVPMEHRGDVVAVLDLRNKSGDGTFTAADQQLVEGLARQAALFLDNARFREAEHVFEAAVTDLVREVTDQHLTWTGHIENVAAIADSLAVRLELSDEKRSALRLAVQLHDIGLLDFPRVDIGPPGGPVDHAVKGGDRLEQMAFWASAAPIVRAHHEQMDGRGPLGLRGFAIPMGARILALAEYVDTVTNPSSPWGDKTLAQVAQEVASKDDRRFDKTVVEAFLATQGVAAVASGG